MKTNVMFFLPNLHGGGAERVTVNILRQLNPKKFHITLVLVNKVGKFLDLIPSYIDILELDSRKVMLSIISLRKVILELQPDIVYSTLFNSNIAVDIALTGISKKPKVIFRSPNSPKLILENKQMNFIRRFLLERAYKHADLILTQTPEMKKEISEYHNINEKNIRVFLNPLDTDLIDQKTKNIENPFDINRINVVAAGRLTKQKGFDILVQSFKYIIDKNDNYFLHIIGGDDGEKDKIQQLICDLSLENHVKLWGFQTNPYQFFYYADIFVLSSRWEGLPNTVLENLYLKKPVVVTKCIPFMEKLVYENKNGKLVDVEDPMQLAQAILNYKSIELNFSTVLNDQDINDLFLTMETR